MEHWASRETREAKSERDFAIIGAALLEAASVTTDVSSYREVIRSVGLATHYQAADVASVVMAMVDQRVLVHAAEIRQHGTALAPRGVTILQRMRLMAGGLQAGE